MDEKMAEVKKRNRELKRMKKQVLAVLDASVNLVKIFSEKCIALKYLSKFRRSQMVYVLEL